VEIEALSLTSVCELLSRFASTLDGDKADKRVATGIKKFRFFIKPYYSHIK